MPDTPTVQEAMTQVMNDVREVAKNDRNTQQNFNFRGVDSVVNAVAPALRKHGVIVLPQIQHIEYLPFTSSKGTAMMCCRVQVTYVFTGPAGDVLYTTVPGEAMDAGDKSTAKAMSVAFRIALLQALALPTDDVDPDAQSYEIVGESTATSPSRASGQASSPPSPDASPTPVGAEGTRR